MKGTIFGIKRMEIHDGDGIRTTVFLKGCPLKCIWCHNPEGISPKPQTAFFESKCISCEICGIDEKLKADRSACEACPTEALKYYGEEWEASALAEVILQDEPFFRNSNGGVTLSGGECLMQPGFCKELAGIFFKRGISVDIDTSGYVSRESLEKILPYTDTFLYDIKAIDSALHKKLTGKDNSRILENLKFLSESGASIEIRFPLVCGCNDGEVDKIGSFLQGLKGIKRVKVLRYHNLAASRYVALGMENTLPPALTGERDVDLAVEKLRSYGLNCIK